jgi:multidrug efflux pump subunit AcrA (membrane-fusion protein)
MSRRTARLARARALLGPTLGALAQDRVYRCGASYSHEPCASGTVLLVDDARSAPQVAHAQVVAERDARLADTLTRQRQQAEQAAARQGPVLIGAPTRVTFDAAACRPGANCSRPERSKRKREKADPVTLYRGASAR